MRGSVTAQRLEEAVIQTFSSLISLCRTVGSDRGARGRRWRAYHGAGGRRRRAYHGAGGRRRREGGGLVRS